MKKEKLKQEIKRYARNSIKLAIGESFGAECCETHFGGRPDLPKWFSWPTYAETEISGQTLPLQFLAQINCKDVQLFDTDGLLPKTGLLSFFYDALAQPWGFGEKERKQFRVLWFEELENLVSVDFPEDLEYEGRFPCLKIEFQNTISYPDYPDLSLVCGHMSKEVIRNHREIMVELGYDNGFEQSKLLGWANIVQENMTRNCEKMILEEGNEGRKIFDKWQLLLQLNTIVYEDFKLMFGDCGNLYFYIKKDDLISHAFDKVWMMLQT